MSDAANPFDAIRGYVEFIPKSKYRRLAHAAINRAHESHDGVMETFSEVNKKNTALRARIAELEEGMKQYVDSGNTGSVVR